MQKDGSISIDDVSGTNIDVQIFDMAKLDNNACCYDLPLNCPESEKPIIFCNGLRLWGTGL